MTSMRSSVFHYPTGAAGIWHRQSPIHIMAKRMLDITVSLTLLILLMPIMAVIAILIRLDSPGPIIFRQKRIGQRNDGADLPETPQQDVAPADLNVFTFYKFRSMRTNSGDGSHRKFVEKFINGDAPAAKNGDGPVFKMTKDARVTRVGRIIRSTSLDELPQLFNVIRGEMSLVGPRPPLPYEVALYKTNHWRRLEVPQGITGLWQVRGRSKVTFEEMVKMDIEYIENWSVWLDLKILLQTLPAVLRRDGAN